jgi:beta-glucosidase/6-phospho-beta-glucosidase/beta-galactosidase
MKREPPVLRPPSHAPGSTEFLWTTGIEDTFISHPDRRTGRILDEYALTQHYDFWQEDLGLIASLGVPAARYGIPWYRVEPRPGVFDWTWTDPVLETLVNRHKVEPIVDLMHYGTPDWLEGAFLSPDYPARVAGYARAFAARYKGLCYWYTPLNEPRINAWYAARLGWWPPYRRTWNDFAAVLVALARGIVETQRAIAAIEPDALFVHVDATDLYKTTDASLEAERLLRQELVFCALDLVQGRLPQDSPLLGWLRARGISDKTLAWFEDYCVQPDIIGYNMYPMFSEKHLLRDAGDRLTVQIRPCWTETFAALTRMYAARYGLPVMCTETASSGPIRKRVRWIEESVRQMNRLRAEGVPVVGYTYWPLFSLVGWAYQRGALPLGRYLIHMGLWDLRADGENGEVLRRVPTRAADAYRQVAAAPVEPLGRPFSV